MKKRKKLDDDAPAIGDRLLTLREAAEVLRLSARTVREYVKRGEIRGRIKESVKVCTPKSPPPADDAVRAPVFAAPPSNPPDFLFHQNPTEKVHFPYVFSSIDDPRLDEIIGRRI